MSNDRFKIEVNGTELEARPGQMLIQVTDAAGVYIPRFCYHDKLSVAANCRMCLVEVANAPKPLPACATPVTDGMKVFTRSEKAIAAQKSVMEFLLINHPLDCPICDQGGECELQDLAMGYGRDISRYFERKRVVRDKNIGPLVSTDMTRCIHCTRCVRFGQEIAGIQELGTIGRGDRTEISTYIEKSIDHELSGNIIDLCPVGALNSKPYRFSARAWELVQRPTIAPHDCFGSNVNAHVMEGRVKRVVPRVNEAVNETWLSDRDRFSYEGIYSPDRLETPMIREDGVWRESDWDEALELTAAGLREKAGELGALLSPSATTEEAYLLSRLVRHLGSNSVDHRLRRLDYRHQDKDPVFESCGMDLTEIDDLDSIFVIESDLRREVPLFAHRVRKAAMKGARVSFLSHADHEYLFPVERSMVEPDTVMALASLVKSALGENRAANGVAPMLSGVTAIDVDCDPIVAALSAAETGLVLLGQAAMQHPRFAELRLLAAELADLTGCRLGYLPEGANSAGASLAGALPHRGVAGETMSDPGMNALQLMSKPTDRLILFGIEPEYDCATGAGANRAIASAEFVVALSPFFSESLKACANIILPIGTFAETSGTFVNVAGQWQSFAGVARPVGASRPGWKVLRVLGNLLELPDCEYLTSEAIRDELRAQTEGLQPDNALDRQSVLPELSPSVDAVGDVSMYAIDNLVRRAPALQQTVDGRGEPDAGELRRVSSQ